MKVVSTARFFALEASTSRIYAAAERHFAHSLRTLGRELRGLNYQHSEPRMARRINIASSVDFAPVLGEGLVDRWLTILTAAQ